MKKAVTDEFFKLVKFGITGVMNTAVDFAVFILLGYIGVPTYPSMVFRCRMLAAIKAWIVLWIAAERSPGAVSEMSAVGFKAVLLSLGI